MKKMEELLRPQKVCKILDICSATLQSWEKSGIISVKKLPYNKTRIPISEVERILNGSVSKPPSTKFKILSTDSPIEDHLQYVLQKNPTKNKSVDIKKICKLVEGNTKYKFTDIVEKFNDLYREGIIFNEGGTKKSHLVFADEI
ncbi:hypothetical protein KAW18_02340 [candidate division WOR-3 bacterium]|nr:hypothetical protein [candidate division WOR-3 bacterium]